MEVLRDEKGRTLYSHTSGEIVEVHKCRKILVKPRTNEEKCCEELAVWSGSSFQDPAYMKAISREVTKVCTPRVCSTYNYPWFNIGTETEEEWIRVENNVVVRTNKPQELTPTSHSKEEQLIIKEDDIFSDDKKEQFRVFSLIQHTRHLLQGEVIKKMYQAEVLTKLYDDPDLEKTDTYEFISYRLQDALLPWPLNMLHIIPDWIILTFLGIVGLYILKIFFDPMVACCTLIRDSSLSLTQKLSSAVLPATSISWMNSRRKNDIENGGMKDVELRVTDLEDDMKLFKTLMIKGKDNENSMRRLSKLEGTI